MSQEIPVTGSISFTMGTRARVNACEQKRIINMKWCMMKKYKCINAFQIQKGGVQEEQVAPATKTATLINREDRKHADTKR